YAVRKEIEDQCQLIIEDVYEQLLKQDKQFRAFVEASSSATKLQQMITYQMSKVFSELDQSFQDFTIEDQTKFAAQVNEYIHSLPEDKQRSEERRVGKESTSRWRKARPKTNRRTGTRCKSNSTRHS